MASSSPSWAASEHGASHISLSAQTRDATAFDSAVDGVEKRQPVSSASDENVTSSHESRLTSNKKDASISPPGGVIGAAPAKPADRPTEPSIQDILNKLIDKLSELNPSQKLSGWAGVEDHLFKHDTGEMKYYSEDIDTLLVFAGLFSAFLTAFVVQTYPMLTDDDSFTTNQLLALSVSVQLRATGAIIPSSVNSTLTSLLDEQPFAPPTSARAMNILFFLSLILSLASAFFGILAKQWLREYLRWNSPLALPRENVLVRQDRIEGWEAWNVAATISSIPALLEIAMILFLCGVVILLWTLDDVVAIIITIFAALFMAAASAFTVLPITYKRCPYKSPTAWACITLYNVCRGPFIWFGLITKAAFDYVLWRLRISTQTWRPLKPRFPSYKAPQSWRERDLESCRKIRSNQHGTTTNDVEHAALQQLNDRSWAFHEWGDESMFEHATQTLIDIAESALLIRALIWVKRSSQDLRIHAYTTECAATVHPEINERIHTDELANLAVRLVANQCILLALDCNTLGYPHSALLSMSSARARRLGASGALYRRQSGAAHIAAQAVEDFEAQLSPDFEIHVARSMQDVVGRILIADLERWNKLDSWAGRSMGDCETCALIHFLGEGLGWDVCRGADAFRAMVPVNFNTSAFGTLRDSVLNGASDLGRLILSQDGKLLYSDFDTTPDDERRLLVEYFTDDLANKSKDHIEILIRAAHRWFTQPNPLYDDIHTRIVLRRIIAAIGSEVISHPELHSFGSWPFSDMLDNIVQRHLSRLLYLCPAELRELVHAIEAYYSKRSPSHLAGATWANVHKLHQATHKNISACEFSDCKWLAHSCEGVARSKFKQCPLAPDWPESFRSSYMPCSAGPASDIQTPSAPPSQATSPSTSLSLNNAAPSLQEEDV